MTEKVRTDLNKIRDIILETVPTTQIYLFAHAYGQLREDSDYDIYVVLPNDGPNPIDAAVAIRRALLPIDTGPVDILAGYADSFSDRCQLPTMEREISKNGVLLYGQQDRERSAD